MLKRHPSETYHDNNFPSHGWDVVHVVICQDDPQVVYVALSLYHRAIDKNRTAILSKMVELSNLQSLGQFGTYQGRLDQCVEYETGCAFTRIPVEATKTVLAKTYFCAHGSVATFGGMFPFKLYKRIKRPKWARSTLMSLASCKTAGERKDDPPFAALLAEMLIENDLCDFFHAYDQPVRMWPDGAKRAFGEEDVGGVTRIIDGHKLRWWRGNDGRCHGPDVVVTWREED